MLHQTTDITLAEVQKILPHVSAWKVVDSLLKKGLIHVYEHFYEQYHAKKEKLVFLSQAYESETALQALITSLERAPKQLNILLSLLHLRQTIPHVSQAILLKLSEATSAQIQAMVDKKIIEIKLIEVDRLAFDAPVSQTANVLTEEQQEAYEVVRSFFNARKPVLLKGITGSGKTHVYMKVIEDCVAMGQQALFLLPEIALTAQLVRKLRAVFGSRIGVYHSRFSNNERVEVWRKVQEGHIDIVIGARSALLLPFQQLGCIIVDEEHDSSYKQQDPAPRYHARDCALWLAHACQANIILGSATPSLESYFHTKSGKFGLVELHNRYGTAILPTVDIIDTKRSLTLKTQQGIFSNELLEAIQQTLLQQKQVILFQNRRGYSPFVMCSTCGWVPHCKYCDVSLTYHKQTDQLHCHYCGSRSPYIKICPACGHTRIVAKSFGTEKIEEDIRKVFPNARVERFDWDVMRIKNKYNDIIQRFENRQIDILVGTQMLVKGLDFDHVNTVGVLSADSLLSYPDFRVNERVFQLLEQVSGRAGRRDDHGRVFIQLFRTDHPMIQHVRSHNYDSFYRDEIAARQQFQYPPFTRMIRLTLKHKKAEVVLAAAQQLATALAVLPKVALFGPAEPSIARIRNLYIQEILLKVNKDSQHLHLIKNKVRDAITTLAISKGFTTVQVVADVDPY